jgi:hypothetical protein
MSSNRAATEQFILKWLHELAPGSDSWTFYKDRFATMDDNAFKAFMERLENETEFLVLVAPNFSNSGLSVKRNLEIAKKLGHNFFQRLWMGAQGERRAYLTPIKYLVVDLPLRRASQLLIKKIRTPHHNKTVDMLTGQPTGDSKGAKISYPELQNLAAMGLDNSVIEMMKYRGGDLKGFNAMNAMIARYGTANLDTLSNFASGVESTRSLKTFLTSMHLKNSLNT